MHASTQTLKIVTSVILVVTLGVAQIAHSQTLSEEGQIRRSAHNFLFQQFAKSRDCKYSKEGTILSEIVVLNNRIEVDGQLAIELPDGAQRVASMFRHLALKGENLDRIGELRLLPYKPDSTLHHSMHTPDYYRVQIGALPLPEEDAHVLCCRPLPLVR